MRDMRPLKNMTNLRSWRAWQRTANQRSGYLMILCIYPLTSPLPALAVTMLKPSVEAIAVAAVAYLAVVLGGTTIAILRLNAWKKANPWHPPS